MRRAPRTTFIGAAQFAAELNKDGNRYALYPVNDLKNPHGFQETGKCMKRARLDNNAVDGGLHDAALHKGSARAVYNFLKKSKFVVKTSLPGDLRFYMNPLKHGLFGHVTRHVYGNLEFEVSSAYGGKNTDCRGVQPLGFLGTPDLIIRFKQL